MASRDVHVAVKLTSMLLLIGTGITDLKPYNMFSHLISVLGLYHISVLLYMAYSGEFQVPLPFLKLV